MPLPREYLLDELATAYVQAVAAVAGATIAVSRRDYGVDGTIKHIATTDDDGYFETGYPVEFQLKGTTLATSVSNVVKYDLKVRNYNLIVTRKQTATPYFLYLGVLRFRCRKMGRRRRRIFDLECVGILVD